MEKMKLFAKKIVGFPKPKNGHSMWIILQDNTLIIQEKSFAKFPIDYPIKFSDIICVSEPREKTIKSSLMMKIIVLVILFIIAIIPISLLLDLVSIKDYTNLSMLLIDAFKYILLGFILVFLFSKKRRKAILKMEEQEHEIDITYLDSETKEKKMITVVGNSAAKEKILTIKKIIEQELSK